MAFERTHRWFLLASAASPRLVSDPTHRRSQLMLEQAAPIQIRTVYKLLRHIAEPDLSGQCANGRSGGGKVAFQADVPRLTQVSVACELAQFSRWHLLGDRVAVEIRFAGALCGRAVRPAEVVHGVVTTHPVLGVTLAS